MRLRGVWTRAPEGTFMCRTHTMQHELSAIAPNFQWVQLFASLGFADIRVGATSADIAVEVVRTCTHAQMHAASCAACRQAPAASSPHADLPSCSTRIAPTKSGMASRRVLPLHCCRFGRPHTRNMQHSTCNTRHATLDMQHASRNTPHATCSTQHSTCNMQHVAHAAKSRRASPVSAAVLLQVGLPARWLPVHVCRWEWSACDERSSRLILVVLTHSPSAAPARSCSSSTQRSQRPGLGR